MKLVVLLVVAVAGALLWTWRGAGPEADGITRRHRKMILEGAPVGAAVWTVAAALGWAARSRLRGGTGHASPAAAWIAKRATAGSIATLVIYAFGPVGWPALAIYAALALGAAGCGVYLANLPSRL